MESVVSTAAARASAGRMAAAGCALLLPVLTACTDKAPAASRPQSVQPAVPTASCQTSQQATAAGSPGKALSQTSAPRLPVANQAPARGALPDRQQQVRHLVPAVLARDYVLARLTYRYDDPTGYAVALTAPAYTTAGFAARSRPTASELARVRLAQEVSTVRVLTARVDGEAPNTATTRYVDVTFLSSQAYRGDGSGRAQRQAWTLRLLRNHTGRWRVDGVPATS